MRAPLVVLSTRRRCKHMCGNNFLAMLVQEVERVGGWSRGTARTGLAVFVVLLVVNGCSGTPPGESPPETPSTQPGSAATSQGLPTIDPISVEMGPVCRQEAVVAGAQPYPGDVEHMRAFMAIEYPQLPDQAPGADGLYAPVGLDREWALPPDVVEWDDLNALICVDVVPGSEYVRLECSTQLQGRASTWDIWGSRLQVRIIDPTTGEVVAEDEPFDSDTLLPHLPCRTPPNDLAPGGHASVTDQPPGSFIARARVDGFIRTL